MLSVPPAAGRQACVIAALEGNPKRDHPEEQDQEDGEAAPHVDSMVHELYPGLQH
jgi:hypothetical protein